MAELRTRLVIDGDQSGAKKAVDATIADIGKVETAAGKAASPVGEITEGLKQTASEAGKAKTAVGEIAEAADDTGGAFKGLLGMAITSFGGIAGAIAGAALEKAFDLAVGAAVDYFDEVTNSATNIKDDLDAHKQLVGSVRDLWDEAAGAASSYGANSKPLLAFQASQNIERLNSDLNSELGRVASSGFVSNPYALPSTFSNKVGEETSTAHPLQATLLGLKADLADGKADVISWRDEILRIANQTELGSSSRQIAADFIAQTQTAVDLQAELSRGIDIYKALNGDAGAAATALGDTAKGITATNDEAGAALPNLREYSALLASITRGDGAPQSGIERGEARLPPGVIGPQTTGGGFAAGGWTGDGPIGAVAGFVHGREYVFDAASTARIGVSNLEAIRRGVAGYASGGYVGSGTASTSSGGSFSVVKELISDLSGVSRAVIDFGKQLWETRNPLQALGSVIGSLSQSFLNSALGAVTGAAGNAISGFINGAIGSLFGGGQASVQAGVHHRGGRVGRAMDFRNVPAALFANAPRFHQGLASDEFAAILQDGETVLPKGTRMGGGQTTVNNWNIETPSPRAFMESRASVARAGARLNGQAWRHT